MIGKLTGGGRLSLLVIQVAAGLFFARYSSVVHELGGHDTIEYVSSIFAVPALGDLFNPAFHLPFRGLLQLAIALGSPMGLSAMESAATLNLLLTALSAYGVYLLVTTGAGSWKAGLVASAAYTAFSSTHYSATESDCYVMLSALAVFAIWLTGGWIRKRGPRWQGGALAIMALGCWTHPLFFFVPPVAILSWSAWRRPEAKRFPWQNPPILFFLFVLVGIAVGIVSFHTLSRAYENYRALGYGGGFHWREGMLLGLASFAAPVDILAPRMIAGLASWSLSGRFCLVAFSALALLGALSLTKSRREGFEGLCALLLFCAWWIFLAHWSSELHFFSLLTAPAAILIGLGVAPHLEKSPKLWGSVLAVVVLALFVHNARLVTIPKSRLDASPFWSIYQRIMAQPRGGETIIIAEERFTPNRLAFLIEENLSRKARGCGYQLTQERTVRDIRCQESSSFPSSAKILVIQAESAGVRDHILERWGGARDRHLSGPLPMAMYADTAAWVITWGEGTEM